jgi:hypothetical protein
MGDSAPVKRRDEENVVVGLQGVGGLAFEFPVSVVDEDQDARATGCMHELSVTFACCAAVFAHV